LSFIFEGQQLRIPVDDTIAISEVKKAISARLLLPDDNFSLLLGDSEIDNTAPLAEFGLTENDFLTIKLAGDSAASQSQSQPEPIPDSGMASQWTDFALKIQKSISTSGVTVKSCSFLGRLRLLNTAQIQILPSFALAINRGTGSCHRKASGTSTG
jgi:hypothetical protein